MSERRNVEGWQVKPSPAWWVVFSRELRDLWIGGKALYLILIYTLLLGLYAFLLASNSEVNLIKVKEVVAEIVRAAFACGLFISLVIAADSFSGERERITLESLLLTPAKRRQIVLGKFLAACSPWPVALAIAIPYWVILAKGEHHILWLGATWGIVLGTLLAPGIVALGMLVSIWCNSNKTSMLVSICFYVAMVLPTEIMAGPAKIQRTTEQWFRAEVNYWISPISAASRFLWKILVIGDQPAHLWMWHVTPLILTLGAGALLFFYAGPRVRLEVETASRLRAFWGRRRRVAKVPVPVPQPVVSENGREDHAAIVPVPVKSHRMRARLQLNESQVKPSGSVSSAWWLVFKKELRDLWFGGRAMYLTLVYAMVMGGYTYTLASDSILSMIPPKEMVYEMLKAAIAACVFVGLIIGADSLSGERERATLEGLLLTPTSRRQLVIGKFLAAISLWPVAFVITIPYMKILAQGDEVFAQAMFWGPIMGTILTPAFTALGMFVGFWCNSNKTSLFVSLCLYLLFMLPTTLLAHAQGGFMGQLVQWANPLGAPRNFLAGVMVNNWSMEKAASWLISPVVFATVIFVLLFLYASPGLRLEGGRASMFRRRLGASVALPLILFVLTACLGLVPVMASEKEKTGGALQISIDKSAESCRAGTPILYNTVVTNTGKETTPPLIVAMNIINLKGDGEPVDPEDWSPQRTQYLESLEPGKSATHAWRINAILDGNFMVYMVAIPSPGTPEATTQPVASSGIHLVVTPYTKLNPGGVLPYAIGGPLLVGLAIFFVYRYRRRRTGEAVA